MMRTAYFDCQTGVSGNMILGALLDAGLKLRDLQAELAKLPVRGYRLKVSKVRKAGIAGTYLDVEVTGRHQERRLKDILALIRRSALSSGIKDTAAEVFRGLARAEARAHGTTMEKVHFHEVGAVDCLVDVVGSAAGLKLLGIECVQASPLNLGKGAVQCAHGTLPVPAPGTSYLLKGIPVYQDELCGELVTPTGAAILTTIAQGFGPLPKMKVSAVGYGAGILDLPRPNLLRVLIGETEKGVFEADGVMLLETNLDDLNPQFYDHVMDLLFKRGALDVFLTPIQMKKNRPGVKLSVLCRPGSSEALTRCLLEETSTLGVRRQEMERVCLARETRTVRTAWGPVPVKVARWGSEVLNYAPEYEACRRLAVRYGVPLKRIYEEAKALFRNL
jgi:pyridinium-3,5-bisthiocarboxylic acid mononucleotide nickel chelatase